MAVGEDASIGVDEERPISPSSLIVVGFDDSPLARKALAWAAQEAHLRSASLLIVSVWEEPLVDWGEGFPPPNDAWREGGERARKIAVEGASAALLLQPDLKIVSKALSGSPAARLIELSKGAELVVIGSRGLGGFIGLMLGSVSRQCVAHARCPVVVVHDGDL
ncbi:MAG: universal stress protein [Ferrimicrobium sp.]